MSPDAAQAKSPCLAGIRCGCGDPALKSINMYKTERSREQLMSEMQSKADCVGSSGSSDISPCFTHRQWKLLVLDLRNMHHDF